MEERKSMGSALVDVFDAGVVLVKSEINAVAKKVGDIVKAKGIGVVLLLAALGPILLGLIFLILAIFYGLMRLGLGAWAAALLIAVVSFLIAGGIAFMGIRKLSAHVDTDMPRKPVPVEPRPAETSVHSASGSAHSKANAAVPVGAAAPAYATAQSSSAPHDSAYLKDVRYPTGDLLGDVLGEQPASANRTVYESKPNGEAQLYGSGLNKKLAHDHDDDPAVHHITQTDGPGIPVSTQPTYPDDMRKEGY